MTEIVRPAEYYLLFPLTDLYENFIIAFNDKIKRFIPQSNPMPFNIQLSEVFEYALRRINWL